MATVYPEQATRQVLVDDAGVAAVVSTRVFPQRIPQRNTTLPAIAIIRGSGESVHTFVTSVGLAFVDLELEIHASTFSAARNLADLVRLAIDSLTPGTVTVGADTLNVRSMFRQPASADDYIFENEDSDEVIHVITENYRMSYVETIPSN